MSKHVKPNVDQGAILKDIALAGTDRTITSLVAIAFALSRVVTDLAAEPLRPEDPEQFRDVFLAIDRDAWATAIPEFDVVEWYDLLKSYANENGNEALIHGLGFLPADCCAVGIVITIRDLVDAGNVEAAMAHFGSIWDAGLKAARDSGMFEQFAGKAA